MNKKFFAALASATMAFSATGSLAVFAQDFEDETGILDTDQEKPVAKTVAWNKDNFGGLAGIELKDGTVTTGTKVLDTAVFKSGADEITVTDGKVDTDDLAKVTEIALPKGFEGEIKGLEYFTGLTSFGPATGADVTNVLTNTSLDFSANTALETLTVKEAPNLSEITLPNANEDKEYSLSTLELDGTALTSLDLSAQKVLQSITVKDGNLSSIELRPATNANKIDYATLDLSNNVFETINLDYYNFTTKLNLSGNRFGALDLSRTTAKDADLSNQKFYVAKNTVGLNLFDAFGLNSKDLDNITIAADAGVELETDENKHYTGVLKFKKTGDTSYDYNTGLMGDAASTLLKVTFEKANPMHRLYNPNSGEHFYTADFEEHDALVALGWNDEGYGWVAPLEPAENLKPTYAVYRLYNANAGDHHYTMDVKERDTLVSYGWKNEGTGWYSAKNMSGTSSIDQTHTALPVYRQYNPYANGAGAHNYTTDKAENDYLVSVGWTPEGTAWYGLK